MLLLSISCHKRVSAVSLTETAMRLEGLEGAHLKGFCVSSTQQSIGSCSLSTFQTKTGWPFVVKASGLQALLGC